MKPGKKPLTRKGRALRRLAAAVGLALLVHLLAGSRLAPSWVKGLAEDAYATGPTRVVVSLGWEEPSEGEGWHRRYLAAGERAAILYDAAFSPWRLGWVLSGATVVDLTEEGEVHCGVERRFYPLREEGGEVFWWCFGRLDAPAADSFVVNSYAVRRLGEDFDAQIQEDTAREEARFGTECCYYRDGYTFFVYSFEERKDSMEAGRLARLEVYDAEGRPLCRDWIGTW